MTVPLVIISNSPIIRVGLQAIFQYDTTFLVHAHSYDELDAIVKNVPIHQLFLLDIEACDTLKNVVRRIAAWNAHAKVVALIPHDNELIVIEAIRLGLDGILDKSSRPEIILESLNILSKESESNAVLISPTLWSHYVVPKVLNFVDTDKLGPLTRRELEILSLLDKGYSNLDIAATLVISLHTVKRHVEHVLKKFDAKDRHECVRRAHAVGLLRTARLHEPPLHTTMAEITGLSSTDLVPVWHQVFDGEASAPWENRPH